VGEWRRKVKGNFHQHHILNIPAMDLVIVHRVNTDIKGRGVASAEFGELVRRVLSAWQPTADTELDTTMSVLMSRHWRAM